MLLRLCESKKNKGQNGVSIRQRSEPDERQAVADDIDLANEMLDAQISRAVAKASGLEIPINTSGKCLYCQEKVDNGRRWCDAECREYYEQRKNNKHF